MNNKFQLLFTVIGRTTAPSLMKKLVETVKNLGYKIDSREKTSGTIKTWLDCTGQHDFNKVFATLQNLFKNKLKLIEAASYSPAEIVGPGFSVSSYGTTERGGVIIQVFTGPKAQEAMMGLDV